MKSFSQMHVAHELMARIMRWVDNTDLKSCMGVDRQWQSVAMEQRWRHLELDSSQPALARAWRNHIHQRDPTFPSNLCCVQSVCVRVVVLDDQDANSVMDAFMDFIQAVYEVVEQLHGVTSLKVYFPKTNKPLL
jgi:hypothetical protein